MQIIESLQDSVNPVLWTPRGTWYNLPIYGKGSVADVLLEPHKVFVEQTMKPWAQTTHKGLTRATTGLLVQTSSKKFFRGVPKSDMFIVKQACPQ